MTTTNGDRAAALVRNKMARGLGELAGYRCITARDTKFPDAAAVCIALTLLCELRRQAQESPVTQAEIQAVIDGLMSTSEVEEREGPMGSLTYHRRGT